MQIYTYYIGVSIKILISRVRNKIMLMRKMIKIDMTGGSPVGITNSLVFVGSSCVFRSSCWSVWIWVSFRKDKGDICWWLRNLLMVMLQSVCGNYFEVWFRGQMFVGGAAVDKT